MTTKQEQNPIVDKIRKLMALSQSPNEHEASLAAQRCQELLLEHNLSMAEVGEASTKANGNDGKREKSVHEGAAMYQYQRDLMKALAKNNFCMHWIEEQFKADPKGTRIRFIYTSNYTEHNKMDKGRIAKVHFLLGREDNVVVTQIMYDYLVETMDRLLPWQGMQKRGKEALLWLAGCTETLVSRLDEQRREKERETKRRQEESAARGECGLVRLADLYNTEDELNQDAKYGYEPGTTTKRRMEREAEYVKMREKEAELVLQGVSKNDAWYIARGMNPPDKQPTIEESPKEKAKREAKERRSDAAWDRKWHRERSQERARRNDPAYQHGAETGTKIGLDQQVADNQKRRIG